MRIRTDTSRTGLLVGCVIVGICLFVIAFLVLRTLSQEKTELPFPKVSATADIGALRKSANDGNAESQLMLAGLYFTGNGEMGKDTTTAVQWLTRAAEQGNVTAQLILGLLYFRGEAVSQDPPTAKEWFAKAGHLGNAEAQYYLGLIFATGKGAPESRTKAYIWWSLAKAQGHERATTELDALREKMGKEEIAEAQKLTLEKQTEIQQTMATPENSVSQLMREAQRIQDDLRQKTAVAEQELERIKRQDGDASKVLKKALPSVVTILVPFGDEISQGTAFFVGEYTLITNYHVVEPIADEDSQYALGAGPPVVIIDNQKRARIAQVIATGKGTNDLAALAVTNLILANDNFVAEEPSPFPALSLQPAVRQGQTVFAIGSPRSFAQSITKGIVGAIRTSDSGVTFIQTDAEITHGNSGGPLLNTVGEVIGVNTLRIDEGLKFAIAANSVETFLGRIPSDRKGIAYLDASAFDGEGSVTPSPTYQPTYRNTTPAPPPTPTHTCSDPHAYYSYAQQSCVCETGYFVENNTCKKVPNCVPNSTFNYTSKQCECDYGFYVKNGDCFELSNCPLFSSFDSETDKCYCDVGYVAQNESCVYEFLACGIGGTYNRLTEECDCDFGYYKQGGQCIRQPSCYGGTFDPVSGGCICDSNHYPKDGSCKYKPSCGEGGYFDTSYERCICNAGYESYGSFCMKKYNY